MSKPRTVYQFLAWGCLLLGSFAQLVQNDPESATYAAALACYFQILVGQTPPQETSK